MDVKPSNVLIAADGLPLLLDFHLARKPIKSGERVADRLGGTPGWMAPEQAAALKAMSLGQPVAEPVNRRADLYSLGLLLCEALCGPGAGIEGAQGKPWQQRNSQVSPGLADIVQKCLAVKPAERYLDAATLADDLRRHLNDLPLRGVANRSFMERWRKWRRRRPSALARGTAWSFTVLALVVAAAFGYAFYLRGGKKERRREEEVDGKERDTGRGDTGTRKRTSGPERRRQRGRPSCREPHGTTKDDARQAADQPAPERRPATARVEPQTRHGGRRRTRRAVVRGRPRRRDESVRGGGGRQRGNHRRRRRRAHGDEPKGRRPEGHIARPSATGRRERNREAAGSDK